MAQVIIPTPLRKFTNAQARFEADGNTVQDVLKALSTQHEGLKTHLLDENGELRSFVRVYLGDEDINFLQKGETPIEANSIISIIPAIAGGIV
jgi:molybdopterin converting factor small subunit